MHDERHVPAGTPETASPYAGMGHVELIDMFYETEGNPDVGRELGVRLLRHLGFSGDPGTVPLVGRNGRQVEIEGQGLTLADYVNYAAAHHIDGLEDILNPLTANPGDPMYEEAAATMWSRLGAARG